MSFFKRKKKDKEGEAGSKGKDKDKSNMPLFKSQSERGRRRQQDQEMLAQQDPEPRFDLSSCEMFDVPSGVYATCKVLQKEVLLLNDNALRDLSKGGDLADLERLLVLDLHRNQFKSLPDKIGQLRHLQVLDLSHNRLSELPQSFKQLVNLQTLKLRDNRLKAFPEQLCALPRLRTLDISQNDIKVLSKSLCYNRALETIVLDADNMQYPSKDICDKATADIMKFLCKESGIEYEHPSKFWGKSESADMADSEASSNMAQLEYEMTEGIHAYQSAFEKRRLEMEKLERSMQAEREAQAELAARAAEQHHTLLSAITQNTEQDSADIKELDRLQDLEKEQFLKYLHELENGASNLLTHLQDYNTKAKETEELLEELESARRIEDDAFKVNWEEIQNVRKQEVLDNMKVMLADFAATEEARLMVQSQSEQTVMDAMEEENLHAGQIESLISFKDLEQRKMAATLAKEDELQRAAFEALLLSQDARHQRINQQIGLVEAELAQLTAAEMTQRARRSDMEASVVAEQRLALSAMLAQLLSEEEKRRIELRKRLEEMEQEREDGQNDYWLVQYQRLLDWKPQSLIDKETHLEKAVKQILISSGAEDYLPLFAKHRITIETMMTLTEDDLSQMGVRELGLRRAILKNLDLQRSECKASEKAKIIEKEKDFGASAGGSETTQSGESINAASVKLEQQVSVTARGLNSECAICLDKESNIIFLPCGHVCCCMECSPPISECPLCRAHITTKVKLVLPAAQPTAPPAGLDQSS